MLGSPHHRVGRPRHCPQRCQGPGPARLMSTRTHRLRLAPRSSAGGLVPSGGRRAWAGAVPTHPAAARGRPTWGFSREQQPREGASLDTGSHPPGSVAVARGPGRHSQLRRAASPDSRLWLCTGPRSADGAGSHAAGTSTWLTDTAIPRCSAPWRPRSRSLPCTGAEPMAFLSRAQGPCPV